LWSKEGAINFQYCGNVPVTQLTLFWFQELEPSNMIAVLEPQDNFNCEQASKQKEEDGSFLAQKFEQAILCLQQLQGLILLTFFFLVDVGASPAVTHPFKRLRFEVSFSGILGREKNTTG
jgi:hypothetical protein